MSKRRCDVEECDRPYYAKGYCGTHYQRWRKWGDPLIVKNIRYADPRSPSRLGQCPSRKRDVYFGQMAQQRLATVA